MLGMPHADRPRDADALLAKELGVRQLAAIIFNYVVGAGIFVLPAAAAGMLGPAAVLAYLVCAVVVSLMVLCFAEAGSRVATSGGPYAYVEAALGPFAGFLVGVMNLVSAVAACAAVTGIFASSFAALTGLTAPAARPAIMLAVIIAAAVVNVRGVRGGARLVELSAAVKLVPLVGFVVVGAFFVRPEHLSWPEWPSLPSVLSTAGFIILAFMGIEGALQPSGEVRHPERTVPRAAFVAIGGVVVLYVAIQLVAQGLLGPALSADRATPLATAAGGALGPAGRTIMLAGATASMFGFLCGSVLAGPRSIFAFGRDGFLPGVFAAVLPSRHTPHVAIVAYAVVALGLGLSGTFEQLAIFTNVAGLLVYIAVAISAWVLRMRDVRLAAPPFRTPGGPLVPALACVCIAAVIVATVTRVEVMALGVALLVSSGVYVARALRERRRRSNSLVHRNPTAANGNR
jgi:amino acid transporter